MIVTNCLEEYFLLIKERPELFYECVAYKIITDREKLESYQRDNNVKIGVIYKSTFNMLVVDLVDNCGEILKYERIISTAKNDAVVVVPVMNGKLVLLEQYRHPIRDKQLCFPRGFGENGIAPEENAKKELKEEIGAVAKDCTYLGSVFPDSGLISTKCDVFLCTVEGYNPSEFSEGVVGVKLMDACELENKIREDMITDGFTLSAFALFKAKKSDK